MYLIGFLILVLLLFFYVLFNPISLVVNTSKNEYYLQMKGLFKASLLGDKEAILKLKLKVLFFTYNFYPLRLKPKPKEKKNKSNGISKKKGLTVRKSLKLLKSIKVEKMYFNVDTGNCITNAKLYPIFTFLNYHLGTFKINFIGENEMVLNLKTRPWSLMKVFINF